jgi:hypothetical protein
VVMRKHLSGGGKNKLTIRHLPKKRRGEEISK